MQRTILLILLITLSIPLVAQQTQVFTQYRLNGYTLNPAKAGDGDNVNISLFYRNQWTGMPGAPETMMITTDGAIKNKKIGLGLNFMRDEANIIGQTIGLGSFSYYINFLENHTLSLGLSLGFARNEIYFDRVIANNAADPAILNSTDAKSKFDADFGLNYKYKAFELGFTTKHLLASNYLYEKNEAFKALNYQLIRHYYVNAQYNFLVLKENLELSPGVLIKSAQGLPLQYEISAMAKWNKKVWLGLAYKYQHGFAAWFGAFIQPGIMVSYAYEHTGGQLGKFTSATHEVAVSFILNRDNKKAKYSDTKKQKDFEKIVQLQSEEIDVLEQENQKLKQLIKENQDNISGLKEEIERLRQSYVSSKDTIELIIDRYKYVSPTTNEQQKEEDMRDRTNPSDYYVIVGTLLKIDNAKLMQKILKREKNLDTKVISREDDKYFFMYTNKYNNRKEAEREVLRLRKLKLEDLIYGNIWIYKSEL